MSTPRPSVRRYDANAATRKPRALDREVCLIVFHRGESYDAPLPYGLDDGRSYGYTMSCAAADGFWRGAEASEGALPAKS